jgi:hypothetical protein
MAWWPDRQDVLMKDNVLYQKALSARRLDRKAGERGTKFNDTIEKRVVFDADFRGDCLV